MGAEIALRHPAGSNIRRWPRYKVLAPVRVITDRPTKAASIVGRGTELNEGGMTVFAAIELAVGEQVAVELTPAYSDEPIRVRCFVKNRYCYTYGLEFITENDADYEHVGQLQSLLREVYSPVQ